jgi:hypothetical protein
MKDSVEPAGGASAGEGGPGGSGGPGGLTGKELFLGLVHSFQSAAMQQMGKIVNPFTQQIERDLPQAHLSIEMLRMLEARTSGNLTTEEARFLAHVLRELQLNYVMELEEEKKKGSGPSGTAPPSAPAASGGQP